MKRVIILLGTTILLVGSIVSLPVSTGAQEPTADPVADDKLVDLDPFADANFANQNGINDTINTPESRENARLNDRVQDRDTFIASLLPGQKSPTPSFFMR